MVIGRLHQVILYWANVLLRLELHEIKLGLGKHPTYLEMHPSLNKLYQVKCTTKINGLIVNGAPNDI